MSFIPYIHTLARQNPQRIVLPEATDRRVLEAAAMITELNLAQVTLVGSPQAIAASADAAGIRVPALPMIDPATSHQLDTYIERFVALRAHKGMTPERAREALLFPVNYAAMMVDRGDADGMVAGCATSTAKVVRSCILIIRPAPGIATISSCSVMVLPHADFGEQGVLVFADTGVVPNPSAEQLADIALSTARTFRSFFDTEARVAMISFSTKGSADHPMIVKAKEATALAQEREPGLQIDGELQVDAALVPEVARQKVEHSSVAGRANILVFPSLDVGNVAYKLVERLAGARALGPVLQGLNRPASDLSRGCSTQDIVDITAIVSVQASRWT
jgi:phosphate acetyltransferase